MELATATSSLGIEQIHCSIGSTPAAHVTIRRAFEFGYANPRCATPPKRRFAEIDPEVHYKAWRRKEPGGSTGLQNRTGG